MKRKNRKTPKPAPAGWWFRGCSPTAWEHLVSPMVESGEPWPEEVARSDLAYWLDAAEQRRCNGVPGYRSLMRRWAWSEYATRQIMREVLGDEITAPSPQEPRTFTAASPHDERSKLDNSEEITAGTSHLHRTFTAQISTRAYGEEEEGEQEEEHHADPVADPQPGPPPDPSPAVRADVEGEDPPVVDVERIRSGPSDTPPSLPGMTASERIRSAWWKGWEVRRKTHPRGAPRSQDLTAESREAIDAVLVGKHAISEEDAILLCRWAFFGDDRHARHLRGEVDEDQRENEYLSPVSVYKRTKLGEKLAKARAWWDEHQARRRTAEAVEHAKKTEPPPPARPALTLADLRPTPVDLDAVSPAVREKILATRARLARRRDSYEA